MSMPKFSAEQSLGAAQGVYINKVSFGGSERLGVIGMMEEQNQENKGTCFPTVEDCKSAFQYRNPMTFDECCNNEFMRLEGSWQSPKGDCWPCNSQTVPITKSLMLKLK